MKSYQKFIAIIVTTFMLGTSILNAAFTRQWERVFTVESGQKVDVDIRGSGEIAIEAGESDTTLKFAITLDSDVSSADEAEERFERLDFVFEESGDTVSLVVRSREEKKGWGLWGSQKWPKLSVRIICPPAFSVSAETRSGAIRAQGLSGELAFDTGSGSVLVRDAAGQLSVDTGSGSIDILNFDGPVDSDTGSGDVTAQNVNGTFYADTGSGSVHISGAITAFEIDTGSGSVFIDSSVPLDSASSVDTGSGSISASLPPDAPLRLHLNTGSGSFDVNLPHLAQIRSSKRAFKAETNPNGIKLSLDTGSGDIRVQASKP